MLNIHQACKARLIERLADEINNMQVEKGVFLNFDTCLGLFDMDKSLPNSRDLKSRLENYIVENPLFEFCYDAISGIVHQQEHYNADRPTYPLTNLHFFQNARVAAEHIINDFETLPRRYTAILEFNKGLSESFRTFCPKLLRNHDEYLKSEDIKLSVPTPELRAAFPKPKISFVSMFHGRFDWQDDNMYLVMNLDGFIPESRTTTPLHDYKSSLKSFIGLALACHLVKKGELSLLMPSVGMGGFRYHESSSIFSHNDRGWAFHRPFEFDENISALLQRLQIGSIAEFNIEERRKQEIFLWHIRLIEAAFQAKASARKIRLSAEWLCDSYAHEDDLSSFVQATTALEILLGGSKEESAKVGLTELLANRLAYLIARKTSDRENIMEQFRDIYDVRSTIVHSGKTRLNMREREMLFILKEMIGNALVGRVPLACG
jgi:hypothetical protein